MSYAQKLDNLWERLEVVLQPLPDDAPELIAQRTVLRDTKNSLLKKIEHESVGDEATKEIYLQLIKAIRDVPADPLKSRLINVFGKNGEFQFGEDEDSFYALCKCVERYFAGNKKELKRLNDGIRKFYKNSSSDIKKFNWELAQVLYYATLQEKEKSRASVAAVQKCLFTYLNNNYRLTTSETEAVFTALRVKFRTLSHDDFNFHNMIHKAHEMVKGKVLPDSFLESLRQLVTAQTEMGLTLETEGPRRNFGIGDYENNDLIRVRNAFIEEMNDLCHKTVDIENQQTLHQQELQEEDLIYFIKRVAVFDENVRFLQAKMTCLTQVGKDRHPEYWEKVQDELETKKMERENYDFAAELRNDALKLIADCMPESRRYKILAIALLVIGIGLLLTGALALLLLAPPVALAAGAVAAGTVTAVASILPFFKSAAHGKEMARKEERINGLISHLETKEKEVCEALSKGLTQPKAK